jgi:hypothetical protein
VTSEFDWSSQRRFPRVKPCDQTGSVSDQLTRRPLQMLAARSEVANLWLKIPGRLFNKEPLCKLREAISRSLLAAEHSNATQKGLLKRLVG